uniref:DUF7042 domain-containing protein n=1 Tax=Timema shepardi TaxID=629360 RepID=A0A7R9B070_TIMSH|nr:unnamed protein product [Timema shepardi]
MLNPSVRSYEITSALEVLLDKKQLSSVQADVVKRDYLDFVSAQEVIDILKQFTSSDNCQLPADLSGLWFQNRVENLIVINTTHIETKGECVQSDGSEKFIFEDNPETCPFKSPPFTFSYNRGSGECRSPISTIDSCTDDSRLLFRYQACPDIQGTESTVEELLCLASWKDGNDRFLVGKVYHKMATTDEQRYRCFAYKEIDGSLAYQVAQSGESTCTNGLSATEGSRTMTFYRGKVVLVPEEACNETNFNAITLPYTTLITASLHSRKCPYLGRYTVSGQKIDGTRRKRQQGDVEAEKCDDEVFESLVVGCTQSSDTMQFYSACASETISEYSCHGSWEDNQTSYLIASPVSRTSVGARRFCFIYSKSVADSSFGRNKGKGVAMLQMSTVTDSCHRHIMPGITGVWALNLTVNG